jgi:hypothetical protein
VKFIATIFAYTLMVLVVAVAAIGFMLNGIANYRHARKHRLTRAGAE